MPQIRSFLRVGVAATVGAASLMSTSAFAATPTDAGERPHPAVRAPANADVDVFNRGTTSPDRSCDINMWGANCLGWYVRVSSAVRGDGRLLYHNAPIGNVEYGPNAIDAGETGELKGVDSFFGGPANMDFYYRLNGIEGVEVHVRIIGSAFGSVSVDCQRVGSLSCSVVNANPRQPIEIRVWN